MGEHNPNPGLPVLDVQGSPMNEKIQPNGVPPPLDGEQDHSTSSPSSRSKHARVTTGQQNPERLRLNPSNGNKNFPRQSVGQSIVSLQVMS